MTVFAALLASACCVTGQVTFVSRTRSDSGVMNVEPSGAPLWFTGPIDIKGTALSGIDRLAPGDRIAVRGEITELGFAPGLIASNVLFVSHGELAPARDVRLRDLDWGRMDNARVAISGVLTSVSKSSDAGYVRLSFATEDGEFDAEVPDGTVDWRSMVDATMRLEGVAMSIFNIRGEFVGVLMRVASRDGVYVVSHPEDPFSRPFSPLNMILPYSPDGVDLHRRHVRGVVTYVQPGRFFWLSDGDATLKVESEDAGIVPGDMVEVVGFATRRRGLGCLAGATARRTGSGELPEPVKVGWKELAGYPYDPSGYFLNYDGKRVKCTGRLLSLVEGPDATDFVVECEGVRINVCLDGHVASVSSKDVSWGLSLECTGVLELEEDPHELTGQLPAIAGWTLRVASARDFAVVHDSAWRSRCTNRALFIALSVVAALLVCALAVGVFIILRVMSQKRSLALLSAERKRMAADLHDTMEQHLAGARMVLNAAATFAPNVSPQVKEAVAEANRLLAHAKSELRARIFNMRSDALFTQGPEKVFTSLARKFSKSGCVRVMTRLRGLPDRLPESVFSELVFIVGEALTNAVKHGHCKTVVIASDPAPNGFTLSVANDGEPFDPAKALGPESGHFGLAGMQERAKRASIGLRFVHEGRWMILRLAVSR